MWNRKLKFVIGYGGTTQVSNEKLLRRSRDDRVLGGVCGGLGEFFGLDPVWFRLLFFILGVPGGLPGLVPYVILWVVVPEEEAGV
jgi:phage shock protein C